MDKKSFKYTSTFLSEITASSFIPEKEMNISEATISKLAGRVPYIDLEKNIDLHGIAFEVALVNQFNENGDGIASAEASKCFDYFVDKPINKEHERSEVIGHVVSASLCERGFGKTLSVDDIIGSDEVFSITLGGVIYKIVNQSFSEILSNIKDNDDEESHIYASWEIGFNEYNLAVGPTKLLKDAVVYEDEASIENFKPYVKAFGGTGKDSKGNYVFRLPVGEVLPLGVGLTTNPAAKVDPIYIEGREDKDSDCKASAVKNKIKNTEENISHKSESNVRTDTESNQKGIKMDENQIKEIVEEALAEKEAKHESIAHASEKIVEAIKSANDKYTEEKEAINAEKQALEEQALAEKEKVEEISKSLEEVKSELTAAQEKIQEMEAEKEKAEAAARFDARLDEIKDAYELGEEVTKIVAKRLGQIEDDEAFESLKEEFKVTFAHLNKELIAQKQEETKLAEAKLEEAKASEVDPVEESEAEEKKELPNTASSASEEQDETMQEKFGKAFNKETVTVS